MNNETTNLSIFGFKPKKLSKYKEHISALL